MTSFRFFHLIHILYTPDFIYSVRVWKRISGDHYIFRKEGVLEKVNLQKEGNKAKPYQVRQVRNIILKYKLGVKSNG